MAICAAMIKVSAQTSNVNGSKNQRGKNALEILTENTL